MKERVEKGIVKLHWMNWDQVLSKESGGSAFPSPAAKDGARNTCLDAIKKGWSRVNPRSKRFEIKYTEELEVKEFNDIYSKYRDEHNRAQPNAKPAAPSAPPAVSTTGTLETPEKEAAVVTTGVPKSTGASPVDTTPPPKAPNKAPNKALTKAPNKAPNKAHDKAHDKAQPKSRAKGKAKAKAQVTFKMVEKQLSSIGGHVTKTIMRAKKLVGEIDGSVSDVEQDTDMAWANNDKFVGKLKRALHHLEEKAKERDDIRKAIYDDDDLNEEKTDLVQTAAFLTSLEEQMELVQTNAKRIKTIHAAESPSQ